MCSALSYLARRHAGEPVLVFGSEATRERMADAGVPLVDDERGRGRVRAPTSTTVDLAAMERRRARVIAAARGC